MSERGRIPRRFVDDRRGHPDARVFDGRRAHPEVPMVGDRRPYRDVVVADRRPHPGIPVVQARRGYPDAREALHMRGVPHPLPAVLEEEFELQENELRRLMADNRALVEERDVLHRELEAGKAEVGHLNMTIAEITTQKEEYISKLFEKKKKLEAEYNVTAPLRDEIMHLPGEIDKLVTAKKELSAEASSLMQELAREKSGNQQLLILKEEIDGLRQELAELRNACAQEQKGNFELVEQRKAMEKNMNSMAQEIEQMRTELATLEARPWGTGTMLEPIYGGSYGIQRRSPEVTFAAPYGESYNIHAPGVSEKGPLLPPESSSWGKYDKNHLQYR